MRSSSSIIGTASSSCVAVVAGYTAALSRVSPVGVLRFRRVAMRSIVQVPKVILFVRMRAGDLLDEDMNIVMAQHMLGHAQG